MQTSVVAARNLFDSIMMAQSWNVLLFKLLNYQEFVTVKKIFFSTRGISHFYYPKWKIQSFVGSPEGKSMTNEKLIAPQEVN